MISVSVTSQRSPAAGRLGIMARSSLSRKPTSKGALWITSSRRVDELEERSRATSAKTRLVGEEGRGDAVHLDRTGVDVPLRVDVLVEMPARSGAARRSPRSRSR
jgi:hypothetical protein